MSTFPTITTLSNQVTGLINEAFNQQQESEGRGKELLKENVNRTAATDVYNSEANLAQDRRNGTFSVINTNPVKKQATELQNVITSQEEVIFNAQYKIASLSDQLANAQLQADRAQSDFTNAVIAESKAHSAIQSARLSGKQNAWEVLSKEDLLSQSRSRENQSLALFSRAMTNESYSSTLMEAATVQLQNAVAAKVSAEIEMLG